VFRKDGRLGDLTRLMDGRRVDELDDRMVEVLARRAQDLARQKGHPAAVARAMVDPNAVVLSARDTQTGAVAFITEDQRDADPKRYTVLETIKPSGEVLTLDSDRARALGMAARVVDDRDGLKASYGLRGKNLRVDGPTWVDTLVATLTTPWMSWLLLFVGM